MRVGPKQLEETVNNYNQVLEERKLTLRFESSGRNGYQAVDEYYVDENGDRVGSWIARNTGCGTSRECIQYMTIRYYQYLASGKG